MSNNNLRSKQAVVSYLQKHLIQNMIYSGDVCSYSVWQTSPFLFLGELRFEETKKMPKLGPIKRKDLIKYLRKLGFHGPFSGGKHEFVQKGKQRLRMPNPHKGDISQGFLIRILSEAGIERSDWEDI